MSESESISMNSTEHSSSMDASSEDAGVLFHKIDYDKHVTIKYAYHLSDIHIRNIQRHQEYNQVFDRLYRILRDQITSTDSIIVITGDIMHAKTEMSPESFSIAQNFFVELSNIAPVIVIPGNHDCNLSNKNRMDALSPIINGSHTLSNVHYLKTTGFYQYHNIIFGVTSVFDNKFLRSDSLPEEYWNNIKSKHKYKIALYHGAVHSAKTDVGFRMNTGQLVVDDFDGYHYTMLGDIHRYQYLDKEKTIAYSGSLIQQSYGENIKGHGVLKWNLLKGSSEFIEVTNHYGFCTIHLDNGEMEQVDIPKRPRIRFIVNNTSQVQYQEIVKDIENKHDVQEIIRDSHIGYKTRSIHKPQNNHEKTGSLHVQVDMLSQYLARNKYNESDTNDIVTLHQKLHKKILQNNGSENIDHNKLQRWRILELNFSNMISYGKDNVIDFRKYESNTIIGIVAPNFTGKSAIIDIILFCLFDKYSRGERRDILNKNESDMYCSLLFTIGSQTYLIERIGQRSRNGQSVKIDVNFYHIITENGKTIQDKLNGIDKNDTNRKIVDLIGTYNDYVTTCFYMQSAKPSNFIDMTQLQKKEYLNELLKLNVFEQCYKLAKEKAKKYTIQLKMLEKSAMSISITDINQEIQELQSEIDTMKNLVDIYRNYIIPNTAALTPYLSKPTYRMSDNLSQLNINNRQDICRHIEKIRKELNGIPSREEMEAHQERKNAIDAEITQLEEQLNTSRDILLQCCQEKLSLKDKLQHVPDNLDTSIKKQYQANIDNNVARLDEINTILSTPNDIQDKTKRIHELQEAIRTLRQQTYPISDDNYRQLSQLAFTNDDINTCYDYLDYVSTVKYSNEVKQELSRINQTVGTYINRISGMLTNYQYGHHASNDTIIENISQTKDDMSQFCAQLDVSLQHHDNDPSIKMELLRKKEDRIIDLSISYMQDVLNMNTWDRIHRLQKELDGLECYRTKKSEQDNLVTEQKLLTDSINTHRAKLKEIRTWEMNMEINNSLCPQINEIDKKITKMNGKIDVLEKNIHSLKKESKSLGAIITDNERVIAQCTDKEELLSELCVYRELYDSNEIMNMISTSLENDVDKFGATLIELDKKLSVKNMELDMKKNKLKEYMEHRKKYDEMNYTVNLYNSYVHVMNYNGLPYDILKSTMPYIEPEINSILHSMTNFSIEIIVNDDPSDGQKQIKSNIGCIDVNIVHSNKKPYKAQQGSGFERFIIGLAIRMALCQISLSAKPNFIIIDEGWSTMDTDNMSNIGSILATIRQKYEYIIVICHNEEMKNHLDYIINIGKNKTHSFIQNNAITIKRK